MRAPACPPPRRPWRWLGAMLGLCALMVAGVSHAQGRVYVSNEKDHQIVVFDAQGQLQGRIPVCPRLRAMAFTSDRQQILVVCGDSNQLGRVDLASQKLVGTQPLTESPEMLALSPDGKTIYVTSEDDSALIAYELASGRQLFAVKTGGEPEGVLLTPDGRYAYVTSEVANMVHRIDLQQKKVVNHIAVGASVGVIDTASQQLKATVKFQIAGMRANDITPVGLLHSPDGRSVWVSLGRANHVAEVDAASRQVRRTVLVGKRAWGLALNKAGTMLYVTNGLSDDLSLVDTAQGKTLRTVSAGRVPHSVLVQE